MARGAGGSRKSRLRVRRVVRAVVIGHVARRAVGWRPHVLVVDMALRTRYAHVLPDERESGRAVIELGVEPGSGVVAQLALLRESDLYVRRAVRRSEVFRMTPVAVRRGALKFASDMAGGAFQRGVCASQRKASELQVIELRPEPGVGTMAGLTSGREIKHFVIRFGGFLIVGHMA